MDTTRLIILATDESPQVLFIPEEGLLEITGKSLPEDINTFFMPLDEAVREYVKNPLSITTINFDLVYLNSASTKRILEIITQFEKIQKEGKKVVLNWYYSEYDDDMKEEGDEFGRLTDIPVNLIKKIDEQ